MTEPDAYIQLTGRILIADDEEEFRRLLSRRAQRLGLEVDQATDGKKALDAVRTNSYDLLVLDIYMPGASGLEVLREGRERDPELQAIVMTAYATVNNAIEALRAGAYDYLVKPLDSLEAFDLALKRAVGFRGLLRENRRLFEEVQRLAMTDALTGLYNRRKLDETLELELERVRRYGRSLSTIMIDLDNLKYINDAYGHQAGDEILKRVADVIQSQVRRIDIPVRYGGDEFLILLPEATLKEATILAERIAARCQDLAIGDYFASFSLGVVEWGPGISSTEDLLYEADQALYEAKQAGGKRIAAGEELLLAWPE
jgi:diguanylate cyclase (GGDEF)-like protein